VLLAFVAYPDNMPMTMNPGVCGQRHAARVRYAFFACLLMLACGAYCGGALAADTPAPDQAAVPEKPPARAAAVPLGELSAQAEATAATLREMHAHATVSDAIAAIDKDLPALAREVEARAKENAGILAQRPALELLRNLDRGWQGLRATVTTWLERLDERIVALDRDLARLEEMENVWNETLARARKERAPSELVQRAESLRAAMETTRKTTDDQRARALTLQARVSALELRVNEALESISRARDTTLERVFTRDSPALWDRDWRASASERIAAGSQDTREAQWTTLQNYAERHAGRIVLHCALFVVLAVLFYWIRYRLIAWAAEDPDLQHASAVVAYPVATALVLSLVISRWMYPEAPRLLWALIGAAALLPTVLVLRRLAAPYLLPLLYAVVVFFFVDQLRMVTAAIALVPRLIFLGEMIGGAAFLLWFLASIKRGALATPPRKHSRMVRIGVQVACLLFAATALANAAGFVALSNLLGNAVLRSMNFGLILYAVVQILDALMAMALRVRPLTLFGMVRRHRELLRRRIRLILSGVALLLWTLFALERLSVRERVVGGIFDGLTAELEVGAIAVSLSDVLSFVLAVWAAFLVSRFVQFVLDEEIYPHAKLKRGIPYAISRTVHYSILVAGFFVAMGVIGVDMTKFTILAGAFTVGVGFGLQNIFNNFVSGLILLFERPVQVGDVIQMDDATGVVERIGIRASIVRTANGSEVIVPNGKLISERLINWTFSDHQRGVELGVSVVLGSDPAHVISVLERVAGEHELVLETPPPQALLTRLGPDWMGFELRAATNQVEDWMKVRSELYVAATNALRAAGITLR
jgi:small-conductance mechanosensitive channel